VDAHQYPAIGVDFARIPNLREVQFYVLCEDDTFDQLDGIVKLLETIPPNHKLKMIHLYVNCIMYFLPEDAVERPQDVESHIRRANWPALDTAVIGITNSIRHAFKFSIFLEYVVARPTPDRQARTKDEDELQGWHQKYLPRASNSPNLVLEVTTSLDED